ncbi:MAG TPA: XdhC/CoxI family protein [Pyrinomonadaceae bacterium]|jgi:xanthine dehydrogenase accessory factor
MDAPPAQDSSAGLTQALARALEGGALAALVTVVEAARGVGSKALFGDAGARTGTTGDGALDEALAAHAPVFLASRAEARTLRVEEFAPALEAWRGARVLFERVEPEPHVVVCGAGHVGAALARLAHAVGYRVTLVDDREEFVARSRFPEAGVGLVAAAGGWARPLGEVIGTGRGVYVAVVTRGHNEDEECLRAALGARPDYVGMIGSRRRTNIVLGRLRESGFAEEQLREVRAPVGLDIGAVSPEEVALAILAEIVARRRGGAGAPLSAWRRE